MITLQPYNQTIKADVLNNLDSTNPAGTPPSSVINITGDIVQGGVVSLTPTVGSFGDFGGVVRQYTKGDEELSGTPITLGTPTLGTQSLSTTVVGLGDDTGGEHLTFDTTQLRTGRTGSLRRTRESAVDSTERNGGFGYTSNNADPFLYVSYFRRFQSDPYSIQDANMKQYYIYSNGGVSELPQNLLICGAGESSWSSYDNVGFHDINNTKGWSIPDDLDFHRWESHMFLNAPGDFDGYVKVYRDNELGIDSGLLDWQNAGNTPPATGWDDVRIGYYDRNIPKAIVDFTDVYIATTPARVELGNAPTWEACTHTELQAIPETEWLGSNITNVTLDKGGLSSITGSYLYVIKANGTPYSTAGELLL